MRKTIEELPPPLIPAALCSAPRAALPLKPPGHPAWSIHFGLFPPLTTLQPVLLFHPLHPPPHPPSSPLLLPSRPLLPPANTLVIARHLIRHLFVHSLCHDSQPLLPRLHRQLSGMLLALPHGAIVGPCHVICPGGFTLLLFIPASVMHSFASINPPDRSFRGAYKTPPELQSLPPPHPLPRTPPTTEPCPSRAASDTPGRKNIVF